jgi:hypothetical protein
MKKNIYILLVLFMPIFCLGQAECDVKNIYEATEPDNGITVLTDDGELKDLGEVVEYILSTVKLDEGKYQIEVTRKNSNLYEVRGQNIYIETRYCYEYANYDDAILILESNYGYSRGKIIFLK